MGTARARRPSRARLAAVCLLLLAAAALFSNRAWAQSAYTFPLEGGLRFELNDAGQASILWENEVAATISLWVRPASRHEASGAVGMFPFSSYVSPRDIFDASTDRGFLPLFGWPTSHPELADVTLTPQTRGGLRWPEAERDDDGDERFDEDPFDLRDNDGDGAIDEDFALLGTRMKVALAHVELDGKKRELRCDVFQWPYDHLDDIVFWNLHLPDGVAGGVDMLAPDLTAGKKLDGFEERMLESIALRPHRTVGAGERIEITAWAARITRDREQRWVAVLPLELVQWGRLERFAGQGGANFWPLAVVTARTEAQLRFNLGQAWLAYEGRGTPAGRAGLRWFMPPLCARCEQRQLGDARIRVEEELGTGVRVSLDLKEPPHGEVDAEDIAIGGVGLAPYWDRNTATGLSYVLPRDSLAEMALLRALRDGVPDVDVAFVSGHVLQPTSVQVELSPSLEAILVDAREEMAAERAREQRSRLPTFLAPALLETWPNPFRASTTLRFRVPATMEEAFSFEYGAPEGLDLKAPPPFGLQPAVRIKVYNVGGQLIRVLDDQVRGPGSYQISWDGTDMEGRPVAAGAYYVSMDAGGFSVTRRVVRLKP